ncbi:hypothetical protein KSS87_014262, partial [Heliosperma pusillum]
MVCVVQGGSSGILDGQHRRRWWLKGRASFRQSLFIGFTYINIKIMKNHWHFHHDVSDNDPLLFNTIPVWYHVSSIVDHSKQLFLPGIYASRQAFGCFSNLANAYLSAASHIDSTFPDNHAFRSPNPVFFAQFKRVSPIKHKLVRTSFSQTQSLAAFFFHAVKHLFRRRDDAQLLPFLSLAAAIVAPIRNLTSNMLAIPPADACVQMLGSLDQAPCDVQHRGGLSHSFPDLNWIRRAVEPITGIEFPGVLNNILAKENQSNLSSEVMTGDGCARRWSMMVDGIVGGAVGWWLKDVGGVDGGGGVLVGTGSRTVTIIKIKSLKLYAFGFYIHPYSVCQKLGSKYASVPASELKEHNEFYADLLSTFEKSLRARLVKTNPETDFKCIETFGSFFTKDIPLPVLEAAKLEQCVAGSCAEHFLTCTSEKSQYPKKPKKRLGAMSLASLADARVTSINRSREHDVASSFRGSWHSLSKPIVAPKVTPVNLPVRGPVVPVVTLPATPAVVVQNMEVEKSLPRRILSRMMQNENGERKVFPAGGMGFMDALNHFLHKQKGGPTQDK